MTSPVRAKWQTTPTAPGKHTSVHRQTLSINCKPSCLSLTASWHPQTSRALEEGHFLVRIPQSPTLFAAAAAVAANTRLCMGPTGLRRFACDSGAGTCGPSPGKFESGSTGTERGPGGRNWLKRVAIDSGTGKGCFDVSDGCMTTSRARHSNDGIRGVPRMQ